MPLLPARPSCLPVAARRLKKPLRLKLLHLLLTLLHLPPMLRRLLLMQLLPMRLLLLQPTPAPAAVLIPQLPRLNKL